MKQTACGALLLLLLFILFMVPACSDRATDPASRGPSLQAAPAAPAALTAGTEGVVFRTDSSSINGVGCWVDGDINGCVQVSRSRTGSGLTTFLFYTVQQCVRDAATADTIPGDSVPRDTIPPPPPPCTTVEGGFGTIPNGDLAGSGIHALRLRTNTSAAANPDFTRFAGSGGDVAVDWTRSGASSSRFTGTGESSFGAFTIHFSGTSWFADAVLAGSVVGFPITTPTTASLFRTQQLAVAIVRGP